MTRITEPELLGFHHGQKDMRVSALEGEDLIGHLDYAEYLGEPHIQLVWVSLQHRKKGIAKLMVAKLLEEYPYPAISWGMTTPEGTALKEYFDQRFWKNIEEATEEAGFKTVRHAWGAVKEDWRGAEAARLPWWATRSLLAMETAP